MQVQTNPYIEALTEEQRKQRNLNTQRHKFSVHGLYMEGKSIQEKLYDVAQFYCKQNHIEFILRSFFDGFVEDREYVERLPAFQVYYEDEYVRTFYKAEDVESILQEVIEGLKKEKKKNTWSHTITQWISQYSGSLNLRSSRRIASSFPNE
jgi:hypothetical protein